MLQNRKASICWCSAICASATTSARLLEQMENRTRIEYMSTNGNRDILVPARKEE